MKTTMYKIWSMRSAHYNMSFRFDTDRLVIDNDPFEFWQALQSVARGNLSTYRLIIY